MLAKMLTCKKSKLCITAPKLLKMQYWLPQRPFLKIEAAKNIHNNLRLISQFNFRPFSFNSGSPSDKINKSNKVGVQSDENQPQKLVKKYNKSETITETEERKSTIIPTKNTHQPGFNRNGKFHNRNEPKKQEATFIPGMKKVGEVTQNNTSSKEVAKVEEAKKMKKSNKKEAGRIKIESTIHKKQTNSQSQRDQMIIDEKESNLRDRESIIHTEVEIPENINLLELSKRIKVDLEELMETASSYAESEGVIIIDEFQALRNSIINLICIEHDITCKIIEQPMKDLRKRSPVITIMGHVDHGKTTLLDSFRNSNLVDAEFGKITQSTAAFSFKTNKGYFLTFIDTPGHEVFDGMRARGAKATDIIIVVISAVEGVQKQTKEVFQLIKKYNLPFIIAINKIDREFADPDKLVFDLAQEGLELDELGGDIPSARISAVNKTGLENLEDKIVVLAESLNLKEDYSCNAEATIVESKIDEQSSLLTACVLVRKGCLSVGDAFICGMTEGRVKYILKDKETIADINNIKDLQSRKLYPGQSGIVCGFKDLPEAGNPLYKVKDANEAKFLVNLRTKRFELEEKKSKGIEVLDKKMIKLDRLDKRILKSGDRLGVMAQLGVADDKDIERMKMQLEKEIKAAEGELKNRFHIIRKREQRTDRLKRLLGMEEGEKKDSDESDDEEDEGEESEDTDEEDLVKREEQKQLFTKIFKHDKVIHQPLIIKAASAGALETVLKEIQKTIISSDKISIIDSGVGPISESDIKNAEHSEAFIFGFNVPASDVVQRKAKAMKLVIRTHKLIFKMIENVQKLVDDMNMSDGAGGGLEEVAQAKIQQVFNIKIKGSNLVVAGVMVRDGTVTKNLK